MLTVEPPMTKRLLLSFLAAAALCSSGCHFFSKSRKQKENPAIATQVEIEFHQRWIAKRVADLATQGVTGAAAQQQAEQEFEQKFSYAIPAKK